MSENVGGKMALPPIETLSDFEVFVTANWIHPIGSNEAQQHARAKLGEEVVELSRALENGSSDDIKSEMGDVLWTAEAVAIKEGFTLENVFRNSSVASQLPRDELRVADIDTIARSRKIDWDVPAVCTLHGLSKEEIGDKIEAGDLPVTQLVLESLAHHLGKSARITRTLPTPEDGWTKLYEAKVAESLTQIILLISHIAQTHLQSSLTEIMTDNRSKLLDRLSNKQPVTKQPRQ